METARLTTWIDWYRFARDVLGDAHEEAVVYANLRYAEELNRDSRHRPAA
jgi:adenosine deaminase